jgi:predicted CXXCH cytochrome family protein
MNKLICTVALLFTGIALLSSPRSVVAEEAADAFDCSACHPMKIRDFKGRRANPIIPVEEFPEEPSGVQDVASTSGMCLSCHDGFVMDSRFLWQDGYRGHRIGMVPSDKISVPELDGSREFPMNDDDKMYCGTCHSAHLNEGEGAFAKVKPFMRQSADGGHICQACHQDKQDIAGSGHDKGSRRAKDFEKRGTCGNCHAPHGSDYPVMWARSLGEADLPLNRLCRACHDDGPNPGEHPIDVVAWSQDVRAAVRSNAPAEMPVFDENGHQARVGQIGCATCHNPHREVAAGRPEDLPGLYLRMPELVEPLCADCHGPDSLFLYKFFHSEASRR